MSDRPPERLADIIRHRFSSRSFSSAPLADDMVEILLEAARWAPSYGNRQSWRFIVARDDIVLTALRVSLTRGNAYAKVAPVLIALCGIPDGGQIVDGKEYYLMDAGLALENLLLQAAHLGLHSHPMGGYDEQQVKAALSMPEQARVLAVVAIGFPGSLDDLDEHTHEREQRPRSRKEMDEIRAYDRWDWT